MHTKLYDADVGLCQPLHQPLRQPLRLPLTQSLMRQWHLDSESMQIERGKCCVELPVYCSIAFKGSITSASNDAIERRMELNMHNTEIGKYALQSYFSNSILFFRHLLSPPFI